MSFRVDDLPAPVSIRSRLGEAGERHCVVEWAVRRQVSIRSRLGEAGELGMGLTIGGTAMFQSAPASVRRENSISSAEA